MASNSSHDNTVDISTMDYVIVPALAAIVFFLLFVVGPKISLG